MRRGNGTEIRVRGCRRLQGPGEVRPRQEQAERHQGHGPHSRRRRAPVLQSGPAGELRRHYPRPAVRPGQHLTGGPAVEVLADAAHQGLGALTGGGVVTPPHRKVKKNPSKWYEGIYERRRKHTRHAASTSSTESRISRTGGPRSPPRPTRAPDVTRSKPSPGLLSHQQTAARGPFRHSDHRTDLHRSTRRRRSMRELGRRRNPAPGPAERTAVVAAWETGMDGQRSPSALATCSAVVEAACIACQWVGPAHQQSPVGRVARANRVLAVPDLHSPLDDSAVPPPAAQEEKDEEGDPR